MSDCFVVWRFYKVLIFELSESKCLLYWGRSGR